MSEYAEQYRSEMRAKAQRMGSAPPAKKNENKVDASDWTPEADLKANVQTGMRPVSRQVFRAGGMVRGEPAKSHAGRKPRASGGPTIPPAKPPPQRDLGSMMAAAVKAKEARTGNRQVYANEYRGSNSSMLNRKPRASGGPAAMADAYINRDAKEANEKRVGEKQEGGYRTGGKVKEPDVGGRKGAKAIREVIPEKARLSAVPKRGAGLPDEHDSLKGRMVQEDRAAGPRKGKKAGGSLDGEIQGTRPKGGRLARKSGGKAKDKMNVNIIITQPKTGAPMMPPPGAGAPPPGMNAPPPQMPPQGAAGAGAPPPMPMGRKSGGRTSYPIDSGAGGGLGRLEKAKSYG